MLSVSDVRKLMEPLKRKVELMVARCVINSIQYSGGIQVAQLSVLADETMDDVEHVQEFGFSSNPPVGTQGVVLSVAGERNHLVIIATDNAGYKPEVEPGESILYNQFGVTVLLDKDGNLKIDAPTKVIVTAPDVEVTGDLAVNGTITATGNIDSDADITAAGDISDTARTLDDVVTAYDPHTHVAPVGGGTTTGPTPTV